MSLMRFLKVKGDVSVASRQKRPLLCVLIIILLSCAVYSNILPNHFVSDDIPTIAERQDLGNVFKFLDVTQVSNSVNFLIAGKSPWIYHLTNIALHAAVSVLVFYFLLLFFGAAASFWGAAVFAVHPAHTEAVTWISGRPYLFLTLFVLASFLLYVRATGITGTRNLIPSQKDPDRIKYRVPVILKRVVGTEHFSVPTRPFFLVVSLIAFTLALFSWISALLFPVMIVLYDVIFKRWRRTWKLWFWFAIPVSLKLLAIKGLVSQRVVEVSMDTGTTALTNPFFNAVYSFFYHTWILLWPAKLTLYREPMIITLFWLWVELISALLIVLCLPLLYKRSKQMFFALCMYVLFLAPTFSPVTICWLVADRYAYLPSVAFSMLIAYLVTKSVGTERIPGTHNLIPGFREQAELSNVSPEFLEKTAKSAIIKCVIYAVLTLVVIAYSARTLIRNRDWRTHASIWRATLAASPMSPKAHLNMGDVWSLEGELEKSANEFIITAQLKPDYAEAYHNLANIYYKMGRLDDAIVNYRKAVTLKPSLWQSYQDMAIIYYQKGDYKNSLINFRKASQINPGEPYLQNAVAQLEKM